MKAGWYVLNYHNVDWENSLLTHALGGAVSPDIFRRHLKAFSRRGELISVQEGIRRLSEGVPFRRPAFSVWFDDGYSCVRKYALPICREFGITAAMSVCSRLALRQEMFWCAKLSYLSFVDGLRFLRSRLRPLGYEQHENLKYWLFRNFSPQANAIIDEVYRKCSHEVFRQHAWKLFDDAQGIQELHKAGWLIANHSAGHYPLSDSDSPEYIRGQFQECDRFLDSLGVHGRFYTVPFEYGRCAISEAYRAQLGLEGVLVKKQERISTSAAYRHKIIYRYTPITEYKSSCGIPIAALNVRHAIRYFLEKTRF